MSKKTINENVLYNIAQSIRNKSEDQTLYKPSEMAAAIDAIEVYPEPTGSISITQNGTANVKNYASAVVNVPNSYEASDEGKVVSSGALVAQTSTTKTANGTYDTTTNNEVVIDVENSYSASDEGKVVSNGALIAQGSQTITENGTYDTTEISSLIANISGGGGGGGSAEVKNTIPTSSDGSDGDVWLYQPPSNVKFVEYLESSGTQYINTGVIAGSYVDFYLKYLLPSTSATDFFGTRGSSGLDRAYTFYSWSSSGIILRRYNSSGSDLSFGYSANTVYEAKTETKKESSKYYIFAKNNGSSIGYTENSSAYTGLEMTLFAINKNGTASKGVARIYRCVIANQGTLVADFIPALDSNNVPCMYESVSGQFVYNAGSGTFAYGNEVTPYGLIFVKQNGSWITDYQPADVSELGAPQTQINLPQIIQYSYWGTYDSASASYISGTINGYNGKYALISVMHRNSISSVTPSSAVLLDTRQMSDNNAQYVSVYKIPLTSNSVFVQFSTLSSGRISATVWIVPADFSITFDRIITPTTLPYSETFTLTSLSFIAVHNFTSFTGGSDLIAKASSDISLCLPQVFGYSLRHFSGVVNYPLAESVLYTKQFGGDGREVTQNSLSGAKSDIIIYGLEVDGYDIVNTELPSASGVSF